MVTQGYKGLEDEGSDTNRNKGFVERTWGTKSRLLNETIIQLTPQFWKMITDHADAHLKRLKGPQENTEHEGDASSYPHARLIIK